MTSSTATALLDQLSTGAETTASSSATSANMESNSVLSSPAQLHVMTEPLRRFTCFNELPVEMRCKIWKMSLEAMKCSPRLIVMDNHHMALPQLLHANHEARTEGLRVLGLPSPPSLHKLVARSLESTSILTFYTNPNTDVLLCLARYPSAWSGTRDYYAFIDYCAKNPIQHVGITLEAWSKLIWLARLWRSGPGSATSPSSMDILAYATHIKSITIVKTNAHGKASWSKMGVGRERDFKLVPALQPLPERYTIQSFRELYKDAKWAQEGAIKFVDLKLL